MVDSNALARSSMVDQRWDQDGEGGLLTFPRRPDRPIRSLPFSYRRTGLLLAGVDAVLIITLSYTADWTSHLAVPSLPRDSSLTVGMGTCCALLFLLSIQAQRLYAPANILNGRSPIWSSVMTWVAVFGCFLALAFLAHLSRDLSRLATMLFFLDAAVAIPVVRVVARRTMAKLIAENRLAGRRRVLLVGDVRILAVAPIRSNLQRHGYNVLGEAALPLGGAETLALDASKVAQIRSFVRENRIDEIFLAIEPVSQDRLEEAIKSLRVFPLPIHMICAPALSALVSRPITDLGSDKAIELQRGPLTLAQQVAKRAFDLALASTGLVVLAPVLVLIAVLIKLDSPGPALFRQRRAGFNGITFKIFKFRSMTAMDDGAVVRQATRDDDRVTRLGRWLRRASVDELPQLLNVIKGDMSLVGPRPHALSHDNEYDSLIASYAFRHHMKPGITGWAQVNGCRGETSTLPLMEKRIEHDLWYIKHWSLRLDVISLYRTVVQMFRPLDVY